MRKRKIKSIIWICVIVFVVAVLIIVPFLMELRIGDDNEGASILSAKVENAKILTGLSGTGTLRTEDAVSISVPAGVLLKEYLVEDGQDVEAGTTLASVDAVSVMSAILNVQETLDILKTQIDEASDKKAATSLDAQAGGRVITLYCEEGDDVREVMLAHGALALLSLDGKLAVNFSCDRRISTGDEVRVTLSDGTQVEGRVEANLAGEVCVTIPDDSAAPGVTVAVTSETGGALGMGELYIHNEWKATAYTGKVERVNVSEGETVHSGDTICTLTDTEDASEFQRLSAKHRVYEEILSELFVLYQERKVIANTAGIVTLPEDTSLYLLSNREPYTLQLLVNDPMGDDSAEFINYVGCVDGLEEDQLLLRVDPAPVAVTDYLEYAAGPLPEQEQMTQEAALLLVDNIPVFFLEGDAWQQGTMEALAPGDTLLFAYTLESTQPVWIVRLSPSEEPPKPEDPPVEDNPIPEQPTTPLYPNLPSGGMNFPSGMGNLSGMFAQSGLYAQYAGTELEEEVAALYSEEETEILTVTPCEQMYLEITVDELDILQVALGQSADVTIDALPGRTFAATVTECNTQGVNSGGNTKYQVTLTLPYAPDMISGMNASAAIPLGTVENVPTLPVAALVELGGKTYVYRSYNADAGLGDRVEVSTGVSDGQIVEITAGLQENDTVWYEYYDKLQISNTVDMNRWGYTP